jgi:hypothetical protein
MVDLKTEFTHKCATANHEHWTHAHDFYQDPCQWSMPMTYSGTRVQVEIELRHVLREKMLFFTAPPTTKPVLEEPLNPCGSSNKAVS